MQTYTGQYIGYPKRAYCIAEMRLGCRMGTNDSLVTSTRISTRKYLVLTSI
jgi:hypothetical protein